MATLVAALVGASSAQAAEIKIGVVLPLSGALSGYGQPSQKGLDIIQAITPTLKNGDTIKLIVIDDKSDKVEAAIPTSAGSASRTASRGWSGPIWPPAI